MNKYIKAAENVSVPVLQMLFGLMHMERSTKTNQAFKNVPCNKDTWSTFLFQ